MKSLQCARAVAALMVVYFHTVLQIEKVLPPSDFRFPLFGSSGVDVFFVLSGFIMWRSTRKSHHGAIGFLKRRVARIAPLYWVLTLIAATIAIVVPDILKSTQFDTEHLVASLAFVPWVNPAAAGHVGVTMTPVIVPGWTLNFEMMFYGLFAVGLIGSPRHRLARLALVFAVFVAVVIVVGRTNPNVAFYDPLLILEFLLGIGIGIAVEANVLLQPPVAKALLVLAAFALVTMDLLALPIHRLVVWGVPAAGCLYALVSIDLAGRWPNLRWLTHLGDASYSLYLTHIFVLTALRIVFVEGLDFLLPIEAKLAFMGAAMTLSCLVGWVVFRFVERPLGGLVHLLFGLPREPKKVWRDRRAEPSAP